MHIKTLPSPRGSARDYGTMPSMDGRDIGEMGEKGQGVLRDLQQLPRFNWGAFLMPPIWGPAHGIWITLLFYPLFIFLDSLIRGAASDPSALRIILAVCAAAGTLAFMVFFGFRSQLYGYLRVADRLPVATYVKRERIWAVVCLALAMTFFVIATWYNLTVFLA